MLGRTTDQCCGVARWVLHDEGLRVVGGAVHHCLPQARVWDLECPQVFTIDGRWYLTSAVMEERVQRYWMGDSPTGPWVQPPDGGVIAPKGHYAGRVAVWKGHSHLHVLALAAGSTGRLGEGGQSARQVRGGSAGACSRGRMARWPACRSMAGRPWRADAAEPLESDLTTLYRDNQSSDWQLQTETGELDLLATPAEWSDFQLTTTLTLDAPVGGIGFRLEGDSGGGYFVESRRDRKRCRCRSGCRFTEPFSGRANFRWTEFQRGRLREPFEPGTPMTLSLISNGPYIEVALDGEVVLATLSGERQHGQIGIWAESGAVSLTNTTLTPLAQPAHG